MKDYKNFQQAMKTLFNKNEENREIGLKIEHHPFLPELKINSIKHSLLKGDLFYHEILDSENPENFNFTYPVIIPTGNLKSDRGVLLLHGLNEKSWDKYLVWAGKLALKLNRPVILFPIAYHMNRAPKSWSDPRVMRNVVQSRLRFYKKNESTFANAALSTRLGANPEQFVFSGIQSFYDVWQLLKQIKNGNHKLFTQGSNIDIFAYSIGAFLSEILFVSNPDKLLSNSRLFLFAGGPTFDAMVGSSKYIMDVSAFKSLLKLRRKRLLDNIYKQLAVSELPDFENTWNGFLAMISLSKGRKVREEAFRNRGELIYAVALEKDKVMPQKSILKTLKGKHGGLPTRVDVIDFPFNYTHENPFPTNDENAQPLILRSIDVIIDKATRFYNQPMVVSKIEIPTKNTVVATAM